MTEISQKTRFLLTLSMLKGVGPATLRKVATVANFEEMSMADVCFNLPKSVTDAMSQETWMQAQRESDKQDKLARSAGTRIISVADAGYPKLLSETRDDPKIIFVKGNLTNLPEKSVAIIGTREPTQHGEVTARRLTEYFTTESWSVISGLAIGCDAIAHEVALNACGHTVAILAHGLQTIAPPRHRNLAERILESGGALVTEYRFGREPEPANFAKRDRIQAGMAQGVVMVQSDVKGGSLHASRAAIEYGRWLAVPYPTKMDIGRKESKIRGNLLLADGSPQAKTKLLNCGLDELQRLIVLGGRKDYPQMANLNSNLISQPSESKQGNLFQN